MKVKFKHPWLEKEVSNRVLEQGVGTHYTVCPQIKNNHRNQVTCTFFTATSFKECDPGALETENNRLRFYSLQLIIIKANETF